jgi:hypothetical protein
MAKFCHNCGAPLDSDAAFCEVCGSHVTRAAPLGVPPSGSQVVPTKSSSLWLSPAGGALALLCFFLPWLEVSCGGMRQELSGVMLAKAEGVLYLIPLVAVGIVVVGLLMLLGSGGVKGNAKPIVIILAGIGLTVMVIEYARFQFDRPNDPLGLTPAAYQAFNIKFGAIGTLLGFVVAGIGALVGSSPPST